MKIKCFTTMHKPYYNHIGKLMIESWSKFWPKECELIVYQEGFEIDKSERVSAINWEDRCLQPWLQFSQKIKGPAATFAKKGYAMIAGMKDIECDLLIWIDADCITHQEFSIDKILSILPDKKLIAFFDTYYQYNPNYNQQDYLKRGSIGAAESGFVVINKQHPMFARYLAEYERLYNADERPDEVGEWFDGNVCFTAAAKFKEHIEDLSLLRTTNKTQTPINRSWIGEYVYHAKAKQKNNLDFDQYRKRLGLRT